MKQITGITRQDTLVELANDASRLGVQESILNTLGATPLATTAAVSGTLQNNINGLDSVTVKVSGDQTIGGIKTFSGEFIKLAPISGYASLGVDGSANLNLYCGPGNETRLTVAQNGNVNIVGDLTAKSVSTDSLTISGDYKDWSWVGNAAPNPTNPATFADYNSTGIYAWKFINGESLQFPSNQINHDYKEGTNLVPHIHWAPSTSATYTGTWVLDIVDYPSVATGTASTTVSMSANFNSAMTAYQMQSQDFSSTLSGTNRKVSSIIHAKLRLVLSSGTSCFVNGLDAHYLADRIGSTSKNTK